jgi:hypothetical protein
VSDRKLALCFAFLIPLFFTLVMPFSAGDLSVWIAHGESFLQTGHILRHDTFSALPTSELIYPSFGISVLYALLYRSIGLLGVVLFHDLGILMLLLWILYRPLIRDQIMPGGKNLKWVLFLFWLGGVPTFVERPAMVALIPLVLSFQIISRIRETLSKRDALSLVLLSMLWANLHGSFILLPLMLGWRLFFQFKKLQKPIQSAGFLLATLAVTLLNPFGWRIYPYLLETARVSKERGITEWSFPGLLTQFPTGLLFWILFAAAIAYLIRAYQQKRFFEVLAQPFFMFLLLGTTSIRNAALTFVLLLPAAQMLGIMSPKVQESESTNLIKRGRGFRNQLVLTCLILALPLALAYKPKQWDETVAFGLAESIKADGRTCAIFNSWELGSFLMLDVKNPIFLDTRNIIYSRAEFDAYARTLQGDPIWESFLNEGKACFVLVNTRTGSGLIERLKANDVWEFKETKGEYTLYAKKTTHSP